jgi:DNA-binding CsgD family transcriptional regulator
LSTGDWGATSLHRAHFVGRDAELKQLRAAFASATNGQGALVLVVGEPGIGKTALCEQLEADVAEMRGLPLVGHCYDEGSLSLPYLPFIEALRPYVLNREVDALREELGPDAPYITTILAEVGERLDLSPPVPGNPQEDRWRLFGAIAGFLRRAALVQPLLLILEDLHDADRGTLDLLLSIARTLPGSRLMVVGTYRDVEVDRVHPLSTTLAELRRVTRLQRLSLRGLVAADVERLLRELNVPQAGWSLVEAIQRQTEGNPLFVLELAHYLASEHAGTGQLSTITTLPEGLRDVIGKRLSRLSLEANQVLGTAAVIGREFRLDVLSSLLQESDDTLEPALAEALAAGIIEERTTVGPTAIYRFTHALFRQALYEELIAPRRIRLHQQVARALEKAFGRHLDEHAAELAEHYSFSSDPTDLAKAVAYGELAAQHAMAVYAYGEAERQLQRAMEVQAILDPDDAARRCDLLLQLGPAVLPTDQPERVATSVAPLAFALAEEVGDSSRLARAVTLALESAFRTAGGPGDIQTPEVKEWLGRADRYILPGTPEWVQMECWKGAYAIGGGRVAEGGAFLRAAVQGARALSNDDAYLTACGFAITMLQAIRDRPLIEQLTRETYERGHLSPRIGIPGVFVMDLARILLECGDLHAADQVLRKARQLAESTADNVLIAAVILATGRQAFFAGKLEDAIATAGAWASDPSQVAFRPATPTLYFARLLTARALHYLGRSADVDLSWFAKPNRVLQSTRAIVLARLGQCDEALRIRSRYGDIGEPADESGLPVLVNLLEASIECRDARTAAELYERLLPFANRLQVHSLVSIGRLLGEAAILQGQPEEARTCFEQALELSQQVSFRPELALIRLDLAELLLTGDPHQRGEGMKHLSAALAEFQELGMRPAFDRANNLLRGIDQARDADPSGLTAREREVARLVGTGKSNREIADALVISEGTVDVHVKHILSKLGFKSRSQVAAWVVETTH